MPAEQTAIIVTTSDESLSLPLTDADFRNLTGGFRRALYRSDGQVREDVWPDMEIFNDLKELAVAVADAERPLELDEEEMANFSACLVLIEGKNVLTATQRRVFKRLIKEIGQGDAPSDIVEFSDLEKEFDPTNLS